MRAFLWAFLLFVLIIGGSIATIGAAGLVASFLPAPVPVKIVAGIVSGAAMCAAVVKLSWLLDDWLF